MRLHTLLLLCLSAMADVAFAQSTTAATNAEIIYKQTYKITKKVNDDACYALLQKWVSKKPERFSRQNRDSIGAACKTKNRPRVEKEFSNPQPLQSLDPAAKKMSVRCVLKYGGDESNCINVMYVEYYMIVEVKANKVTATINKFKYHHFDRKNYAAKQVYSWSGEKPADGVGTVEYLNETMGSTKDVQVFMVFLKADINKLFGELKTYLSTNKALG